MRKKFLEMQIEKLEAKEFQMNPITVEDKIELVMLRSEIRILKEELERENQLETQNA